MKVDAPLRVFFLSVLTALTPVAIASSAAAQSLPSLPIQFSPDQIVTQGREGSTSGVCEGSEGSNRALSAIAYTNPSSQAAISARTSQARPTLWFHSPVPINEETNASFVLKNSLNAPLYEGTLSGQTDSTGIISIPLSIDLAVGDLYQWSLSLNCAENEAVTVSGWIERRLLDSALRQTFVAVDDRNRAALYANYGYLQDTLSELAALRLTEPENEAIAQDWSNFLSDLNLSELASEPILECCQIGKEREEDSNSENRDEEDVEEEIEDVEQPEDSELEENQGDVEPPEDSNTAEEDTSEEAAPEAPEAPEEDGRTLLQRARDRG